MNTNAEKKLAKLLTLTLHRASTCNSTCAAEKLTSADFLDWARRTRSTAERTTKTAQRAQSTTSSHKTGLMRHESAFSNDKKYNTHLNMVTNRKRIQLWEGAFYFNTKMYYVTPSIAFKRNDCRCAQLRARAKEHGDVASCDYVSSSHYCRAWQDATSRR